MTTTALTEYPGLEAKAQKMFEIPYAELTPNLQEAVRSSVRRDASESMLWALSRIIEDLPAQRNWLDPDVERIARYSIQKARGEL